MTVIELLERVNPPQRLLFLLLFLLYYSYYYWNQDYGSLYSWGLKTRHYSSIHHPHLTQVLFCSKEEWLSWAQCCKIKIHVTIASSIFSPRNQKTISATEKWTWETPTTSEYTKVMKRKWLSVPLGDTMNIRRELTNYFSIQFDSILFV